MSSSLIALYLPDIGFEIDSKLIKFGEHRSAVRQTLSHQFEEQNQFIDNAKLFGGDTSHNITYRSDNYESFKTIYTPDDFFMELEIHKTLQISVMGITLTFGKDIAHFLSQLKKVDDQMTEIEPGMFLFANLKMTIGTSESMGGDGNGLDYFYAGKDIRHLID
jgi:hypothetical protein